MHENIGGLMMLRGEVLSLYHLGPPNGDSIKEELRQAMLQHEIIFKNQVRELHRLYWTQKNLMNELGCGKSDAHAPSSSQRASKEFKGSPEEKGIFQLQSDSRVVRSMQPWKIGGLTECRRSSSEAYMQGWKSSNLKLPANEYTDNAVKVNSSICVEKIVGLDWLLGNCRSREANVLHGSCANARNFIDLEKPAELESNSDAGLNTLTNNGADACGSRPNVSSDLVPGIQNDCGRMPGENHSHVEQHTRWEEQKPPQIDSGLYEPIGALVANSSTQMQQQASGCKRLHIDLNVAQDDEATHGFPDSVQTFPSPSTSSSVVHHDGLCKESNSRYLKECKASDRCPKEPESSNRCPNESSVTLQPDIAYPAAVNSGEKNADWSFHGSQDSHPSHMQASADYSKDTETSWTDDDCGLDYKIHGSDAQNQAGHRGSLVEGISSGSDGGIQLSTSGRPLSYEGLPKLGENNIHSSLVQPHSHVHGVNRRKTLAATCSEGIEDNNLRTSVGSTDHPQAVTRDTDERRANREGSEEDTVSSHTVSVAQDEKQEGEFVREYPTEIKHGHTTENNECTSQDRSMEENAILSSRQDSGTTQLDCLLSKSFHCEQASVPESCGRASLKDRLCNNIKSKPQNDGEQQPAQTVEMDHVIITAAETLLSIYSEGSTCFSNPVASPQLTELDTVEGYDKPQCSDDSFESIILKLQEFRDDAESMPATPTEKEAEKAACGIKLRRGRGFRDFQKDILPGLVSLSRHEICEDLHSIGYELRKRRPRKTGGENWSTLVGSRRSRFCSVGRRC